MNEGLILKIEGLENGEIALNPTAPFPLEGKEVLGLRVEPGSNELGSRVAFARRQGKDTWRIDESIPKLELQDPSYMVIGDQAVLVGVRAWREGDHSEWRQEIYTGPSIRDLQHICSGPNHMKDIRLVDLGGKIGVFTRPQGGQWGKGQIGYFEIGSLKELPQLTVGDWYGAKIIPDLFGEGQWGGVNQARANGEEIQVVGHVAHSTGTHWLGTHRKHYFGTKWTFDPRANRASTPEIILRRDDFPDAPAKKELEDVVFPAGLSPDGKEVYCGISDRYCSVISVAA